MVCGRLGAFLLRVYALKQNNAFRFASDRCSIEEMFCETSVVAPHVVPSTLMVGAVFYWKWTPKLLEPLAALIVPELMKRVGKQERPTLPSRLKPDIKNRVKVDSKKKYGVLGSPADVWLGLK